MNATARLVSLATAVPAHVLRQTEVMHWARGLFRTDGEIERLLPAYANAGIETRYSCVPLEWYGQPHGWAEKNRLYIENAVELLERAAQGALERAGLAPGAVDSVVTVSTSGIAAPSLDALLVDRLGLRPEVRRLPIFGLGCAGGVLGLTRAAALARASPGETVLFLVVELCGLTFRRSDKRKCNVIATALFGDGAAAALVDTGSRGLALGASGEYRWPNSLEVMGWRVEDDGLGVLFSRDIPELVRRDLRPAAERFLVANGLRLSDIAGFICHPGGAKVLSALEDAFGLEPEALADARATLRDFGNISAASVLFVLERSLARMAPGRHLMSALGPGFTAGFLVLEAG